MSMTPDQNQESKEADLITQHSSTQTAHVALVLLIESGPKLMAELAKSHCVARSCRGPARLRRVSLDLHGDLHGREKEIRPTIRGGRKMPGLLQRPFFGCDVELSLKRRIPA